MVRPSGAGRRAEQWALCTRSAGDRRRPGLRPGLSPTGGLPGPGRGEQPQAASAPTRGGSGRERAGDGARIPLRADGVGYPSIDGRLPLVLAVAPKDTGPRGAAGAAVGACELGTVAGLGGESGCSHIVAGRGRGPPSGRLRQPHGRNDLGRRLARERGGQVDGDWLGAAGGRQVTVTVPNHWNGRFWGRTGCYFDAAGKAECQTGDCGGHVPMPGFGSIPATLAEYDLDAWDHLDFYDVSMVDGSICPCTSTVWGARPDPISPTAARRRAVRSLPSARRCCRSVPAEPLSAVSRPAPFGTDQYCCLGLQAARLDHLPRQQYWSVPKWAQAEMQPTTAPRP